MMQIARLMTSIRTTWLALAAGLPLLALGLFVPAFATDIHPLPPEEVFRYVIYDAGDALEIDWAVNDGAYMYRDSFGFESGDASHEQPEFRMTDVAIPVDQAGSLLFLKPRGQFYIVSQH